MLTAYEQRLILSYLANAISRLHRDSPEARELTDWVWENADLLGPATPAIELCQERPRRRKSESGFSKGQWGNLRTLLMEGRRAGARGVRGDRLAVRLRSLGREMQLSRTDVAILEILLRYRVHPVVESLIDGVFEGRRQFRRMTKTFNVRGAALPCFLGITGRSFLARFAADAPLVRSGLVSVDDEGDFTVIDRLYRLGTAPGSGKLGAHELLLDLAPLGELEWSDFDHVMELRDHVEGLLKGALRAGATGVNVLVHGEPGTGKTEFCRTLARRLGVILYTVGEADDDGGEPTRRERLQELRLAQRLLAGSTRSLLLFDEMEDLLSDPTSFGWMPFMRSRRSPFRAEGSKVFMNRVLEQTPIPTLWTSNVAGETSDAVLRRMMFAVELRQPPSTVRARIWSRQLARHGIESDENDARTLASDYDVTPGVASGVTAAAGLVDGGGLDAVRCGVRSLARVLSREKPPQGVPERFDAGLVRADTDLVVLADRLAERGPAPISICLQGPPGNGKERVRPVPGREDGPRGRAETGVRPSVEVGG